MEPRGKEYAWRTFWRVLEGRFPWGLRGEFCTRERSFCGAEGAGRFLEVREGLEGGRERRDDDDDDDSVMGSLGGLVGDFAVSSLGEWIGGLVEGDGDDAMMDGDSLDGSFVKSISESVDEWLDGFIDEFFIDSFDELFIDFIDDSFIDELFIGSFIGSFIDDSFIGSFINEPFINEPFINEPFINDSFIDSFIDELFIDSFIGSLRNEPFINEPLINDSFASFTDTFPAVPPSLSHPPLTAVSFAACCCRNISFNRAIFSTLS